MKTLEQQLHDHISAAIRWGMDPIRPAYQRALAELTEKSDQYDVSAFIALREELETKVLALVPDWVKIVIEKFEVLERTDSLKAIESRGKIGGI